MNAFLNTMKQDTNYGLTANGAVTHKSTLNEVLDLFAVGAAYRNRSEDDCITLFKSAFERDESLALKCLFYLRDIRGGQGERRFFRVVTKWLANHRTKAMRRNIAQIPEYGRWDDLYIFVDTPLEDLAFSIMYHQLSLDVTCKTPSLLAKWLKSENASAAETRRLGRKTREAFHMTPKQYRKTLSILRERIRIVERLMSQNRWEEIEFDKIPSRAGLIYRNAFVRRDILKERYEKFAKDENKTVNADALYPHDVAHKAFELQGWNRAMRVGPDSVERLMLQKYWDNLKDFYNGRQENGIAIVDTSGSMNGVPMEAAVSMGAYIAEKAHGPFAGHFITFSANPHLVKFEGVDIADKLNRCVSADWGINTNLEAVFDLLLNTALSSRAAAEDMPERLYIFSDMQFDQCVTSGRVSNDRYGYGRSLGQSGIDTLMDTMRKKWAAHGFKLPSVVFWNLNAWAGNNIPAIGPGFSYVSGFSPVMIEQILSGKDGIDLMLDKLNSERYAPIR